MEFLNDLKVILKYIKPYRKQAYFLIFLSTLASAANSSIPYIYGKLFDNITKNSGGLKLTVFLLCLWLFLTIISDFLRRKTDREGVFISVKAGNDFLLNASKHLISLPISFHKKKRQGKIMSRIYQASNHIDQIISNFTFDIVPMFLYLTFIAAFVASIDFRLVLMLLFVFAIYVFMTIIKMKPIIKGQELIQRTYDKSYGDIHESVSNAFLVKIFNNEKNEVEKIKQSLKNVFRMRRKTMLHWSTLEKWQQSIFSFGFILIFASGIYFMRSHQITTGSFITLIGYIFMAFTPLSQLSYNYRWIKRGVVIVKRAEKIFSEKPEPYHKKGKTIKKVKGKVEFRNISFAYDDKTPVLENISFKADAGETIALVGESGVGKTTIIDLISRYYPSKNGEILIDGTNIKKLNLSFLRSLIAIVPQEITMFNDTIKNNIRYAKKSATDEEIIDVAKAANADEFINNFPKKYKQLVGERGIKLSTGQKQRVAIARALLRNPKILILDEATSSLDSISENLVQEALSRLIKNRTTFIIAHRLSTITHADKIIVLEKGRVAEIGTHEELLKKGGVYFRLYSAQKF